MAKIDLSQVPSLSSSNSDKYRWSMKKGHVSPFVKPVPKFDSEKY